MSRKLIQFLALISCNAYAPGFIKGRIYRGPLKNICAPGLNCYSCPGALGSCPLGALQATLGDYRYRFSFYVTGLMVGYGTLFGRAICGFLCPFGLMQELLYKIPFWRVKKLWKRLLYVKYALLLIFVLALPLFMRNNLSGAGAPAFCKYICPAGTVTAGLPLLAANPPMRRGVGRLFALKAAVALFTLAGCMAVCRFFCKVLCPLGAFYGLFNKIAPYRIRLDADKCIHCGACAGACQMDVDPSRDPDSAECVRCGCCVSACPRSALRSGLK